MSALDASSDLIGKFGGQRLHQLVLRGGSLLNWEGRARAQAPPALRDDDVEGDSVLPLPSPTSPPNSRTARSVVPKHDGARRPTHPRRAGFADKTMIVWHKIRKDGGPDGRGVGFYFRNVTETVLFGIRGGLRTLPPGRSQVNFIATRKREHSRKPDELYPIVEACSPGPFLELFARYPREGWSVWGNEKPPPRRRVTPQGRQFKGYGVVATAGDGPPPGWGNRPHPPARVSVLQLVQGGRGGRLEAAGTPQIHGQRVDAVVGASDDDRAVDETSVVQRTVGTDIPVKVAVLRIPLNVED